MSFKNGSDFDLDLRKLSPHRMKGHTKSKEHRQKISEAHMGKTRCDKMRQIFSETAKDNAWSQKWVYHTPYGVFDEMKDAQEACGVHPATIRFRCKSKNFPDYYREKLDK